MTGISWLAMLAVFSSLSMNLMLQFGLGLKELVLAEKFSHSTGILNKKKFLTELGVLFFSILFLWIIFSLLRSLLPLGFFEFILLFPVSYLVFYSIVYLLRYVRMRMYQAMAIRGQTALNGIFTDESPAGPIFCGAGLFIALNIAGNFGEALILSLGFIFGIALTTLIVSEIRRRSEMEAVPQFLRGIPLALIALGLLSLVFSSAAIMFFEVLVAN